MIILSTEITALPSNQWEQGYLCIQQVKKQSTAQKRTNCYLATKPELYQLFSQQSADVQIGHSTCKQITVQSMISYLEHIEHQFTQAPSDTSQSIIVTTDIPFAKELQQHCVGVLDAANGTVSFKNIPLEKLWKFKNKWLTIRVEGLVGSHELPKLTIKSKEEQQYLF